MASHGIEGLIIQTRNWGRTVAFWQALGYRVDRPRCCCAIRTAGTSACRPR